MDEIQDNFSKIYDQYVAKIYRFIYLKVSSQEVAEDLSSEVFMRTWETYRAQAQNPKPKIQNIQAYLYQVARNIVADHYRARKIRIVSVEETVDIVDSAMALEDQALVNMEMDRIQKALATIQDDYQNLIIWRYLDELSVPEIMQITGKSEDNIRVGIHRALQALKARLPLISSR
ncbi:MAG: sigma-70 family RNA polymerase sigma factor [Candidatus Wildermuthbacteria bacterium]|nr:sigma-70 family RNA polymerase sigma factor [Candidatus Wildermuthbacteria bacterium]